MEEIAITSNAAMFRLVNIRKILILTRGWDKGLDGINLEMPNHKQALEDPLERIDYQDLQPPARNSNTTC